MSFTVEWLSLRFAADERAKAQRLHAMIRNWFDDRDRVRILDLGCGTGATVANFAAWQGPAQEFVLVDNDPALLAEAAARPLAAHQTVETLEWDLRKGIAELMDPVPDLVVAQAFFDLTSPRWMRAAVAEIAGAGAALYAPLIYDGRMTWEPPHPLDDGITTAFHVDMERDKGLGPAAGAEAAAVLGDMLAKVDYSVWQLPSDWELTAGADAALIEALAAGIGSACLAALGPAATNWGKQRMDATSVLIGHQDIFAVPAGA